MKLKAETYNEIMDYVFDAAKLMNDAAETEPSEHARQARLRLVDMLSELIRWRDEEGRNDSMS